MEIYNKIDLCLEMLQESENIYDSASCRMDYIKSILLSGAAIGVMSPLLESKGIKTAHKEKVELLNYIFKETKHSGIFNYTYNSLKHAGNKRGKIEAWDDIEFEGHLTSDAKYLLKAAKKDMLKLSEIES